MSEIQERIDASGKSNAAIGAEVGAGRVTVWRWRKGLARPSEEQIGPLARALGCRPADLRPEMAALYNGNGKARTKRAK